MAAPTKTKAKLNITKQIVAIMYFLFAIFTLSTYKKKGGKERRTDQHATYHNRF
jgi:hypothetical protein